MLNTPLQVARAKLLVPKCSRYELMAAGDLAIEALFPVIFLCQLQVDQCSLQVKLQTICNATTLWYFSAVTEIWIQKFKYFWFTTKTLYRTQEQCLDCRRVNLEQEQCFVFALCRLSKDFIIIVHLKHMAIGLFLSFPCELYRCFANWFKQEQHYSKFSLSWEQDYNPDLQANWSSQQACFYYYNVEVNNTALNKSSYCVSCLLWAC